MLVKRAKYDPLFYWYILIVSRDLARLHVKPGIMVTIGKTVWVFAQMSEFLCFFFFGRTSNYPY